MTREETDVNIVQQMMQLPMVERNGADVFVLLHYYAELGLTCSLTMEGANHCTTLIDITATVKKQTGMIASSSTYTFLLCHSGTVV